MALACIIFVVSFGVAFIEDEKSNYDSAISSLWVCCITVFFLLFLVLSSTPLFNEDDAIAHGSKICFAFLLAVAFGLYFLMQVGYYEAATENPTVTVGTSFIPEHELETQRLQFYVTMTYDVVGVQKGNGPLRNKNSEEIVKTLDRGIQVFPILTLSGEIDSESSTVTHEVRIPTDGIFETLDMYKWWNSTCDVIDGVSEFDVEDFLICAEEHSQKNTSNSINSADSTNDRRSLTTDCTPCLTNLENELKSSPRPIDNPVDCQMLSHTVSACYNNYYDNCDDDVFNFCLSHLFQTEFDDYHYGPEAPEWSPPECGEVCPPGYIKDFIACFNQESGHMCSICSSTFQVEGMESCASASQDEVQTVKSILNEGNSGKVRGLGMTLDFSNEDLVQCDKRICKFINLYLMIDQEGCDLTDITDPSKLCDGQIYELLNMIFFSESSTNNEQNVLQSDRRLKTKYNLLFERETSLTKEQTFRMVTSNIQYGEEPKRNTKQFVKVSFVLPKRQGEIEVSTSEAVVSYTLGSLWTTIIATFSVVSQAFLFAFPNILHKSYFRFQKWVPIVTETKKLEEESLDGGVTYEDFETTGSMMEMAEPEKRMPVDLPRETTDK